MLSMAFHHSPLTTVGFAALTVNSALAIYRSRDDPASVAFVAGAYASVALLFHFLRRFERGEGDKGWTKAAVWLLTTLLMVMFASRIAPLMPLGVGALVLLCLREFEAAHQVGFGNSTTRSELLKMGFGVAVCGSALADHHARGDAGSLVLVCVSYVGFVTLAWLFLRRFDGLARGAGQQ